MESYPRIERENPAALASARLRDKSLLSRPWSAFHHAGMPTPAVRVFLEGAVKDLERLKSNAELHGGDLALARLPTRCGACGGTGAATGMSSFEHSGQTNRAMF